MARYYEVYATGVHGSGPRWSEVYADAATGQDVLTAAYPVYDLLQTPKQFFGVVGVDILPGPSGLDAKSDWATMLAAAHAATRTCPSMVLTAADEEALRKRIGGQTCSEALDAAGAAGAGAGAAVGGAIAGLAVVGAAVFAYKKWSSKGQAKVAATAPQVPPQMQAQQMGQPMQQQQMQMGQPMQQQQQMQMGQPLQQQQMQRQQQQMQMGQPMMAQQQAPQQMVQQGVVQGVVQGGVVQGGVVQGGVVQGGVVQGGVVQGAVVQM
jgi:hypothetical protein